MIRILLLMFVFFPFQLIGQTVEIDSAVVNKFSTADLDAVATVEDLANQISILSTDKTEQMQLLLLWAHKNMEADSVRFFHGGPRVTAEEAFTIRKGLCEDYSAMVNAFCRALGIPELRIEGYVRPLGFKAKSTLTIGNHVWNAVYIDSQWLLCDLFWSTSIMRSSSQTIPGFERKLSKKYYLSSSSDFIDTHLPLDPVFQFTDYPIKLEAFTNVEKGIDEDIEKLPYCNYLDSIRNLQKLSIEERELQIAQKAYLYNPHNPNVLIAAYYNHAVPILNNPSAKKAELLQVKQNLTAAIELLHTTDDRSIKALAGQCQEGVAYADQRLKAL